MTYQLNTEDVISLRNDQITIREVTGTEYPVKLIHTALELPLTDQGIARRIIVELGNDLKFDRTTGMFAVKAGSEFKKAGTQLMRDITEAAIKNLTKEGCVIQDATKAGIITMDTTDHMRKIFARVQGASTPSILFDVLAALKAELRS